MIDVRSPYDGREMGRLVAGTAEDLDRAVASAVCVLRSGAPPPDERAAVLDRAAVRLADPEVLERFAQLTAMETAKPLVVARAEAVRAVDTFSAAAAAARTVGRTMDGVGGSAGAADTVRFVLHVPIGVVAAIGAFNVPLDLVAHQAASAMAVGCPMVVKPATAAPLASAALADLLREECGWPAGWLQVVACSGPVADRLVRHDDVAMVSFTGSPAVGWAIRARALRKRVGLELLTGTSVIIEPDADLEVAAAKIAVAGFSFAGQTGHSVQRVYVHADVSRAFAAHLVVRTEALVVGDPLDATTDVSALIDERATARVACLLTDALAAGATVACGGSRSSDGVLRPTVVTGVQRSMAISTTEVFGPVVGLRSYGRFEDAIRLANDERHRHRVAVFTTDIHRAMQAARSLEFADVGINDVPRWPAEGGPTDASRTGPARSVGCWT